jgi:adenylate kinase
MGITTANNIFFVGGIHGVGKSTICRQLAIDLNINYLSASEVLKWKELNTDVKNKRVNDIPDTQDRLIAGLQNIVIPQNYYILDGHFCLFNKDGLVTKIPLVTFAAINPISLTIIVGDIEEILAGLQNRDQKTYSQRSLIQMQELEMEYAQEISEKLKVRLHVLSKNGHNLNYKNLLSQFNESLT